jgi:zinc transport system substrate-binding protein
MNRRRSLYNHGRHGIHGNGPSSVYSVLSVVCVVAVALFVLSCSSPSREEGTALVVFTSIPPVAGVVENVGGPHIRVSVLAEKGQDPHTFEPTPKQIAMLGKARLYFTVGLPFENRLKAKLQSTNRSLTVVDITEGIEKRSMTEHHHHEDSAADEADHAGEAEDASHNAASHSLAEPDPHVWLSPVLLQAMSSRVAEVLAKVDPANAPDYARSQKAFSEKVDALDARIQKQLEPYRGRAFYVFHPAFGYFADRYGLRQEAVEVDGKSPAPKQLAEFVRRAEADRIKTLFIQPQFDPKSAEAIARAIGGRVETLNDLSRDVVVNLEDMAAKIEASFQNNDEGRRMK